MRADLRVSFSAPGDAITNLGPELLEPSQAVSNQRPETYLFLLFKSSVED
jgi:hypothetical protein